MSTLFVTATGTDIGKTYVSAALIRQLRARGRSVEALKPVLSGYDPAASAGSDAAVLLDALGEPVTAETLDAITPWRYRAPLSPDMAAAQEGTTLPYEAVVAHCRARMARARDILLIEGVGGVMVPLAGRLTVLDWLVALQCPALLVTGSYLGTLSHTLTALLALESRGVPLAGIIVNETAGATVGLAETAAALARFTTAPIRIVPRAAPVPDLAELVTD